jgi:serine protease
MDDGNSLLARSGDSITMMAAPFDYGTKQGTSMATPHAAGVAALAWAVAPNATHTQVRTAMIMTAGDLGAAGFDTAYGFGVLNALNAAKMMNPAAFGAPATPEDPGPSGRRTLRRGR